MKGAPPGTYPSSVEPKKKVFFFALWLRLISRDTGSPRLYIMKREKQSETQCDSATRITSSPEDPNLCVIIAKFTCYLLKVEKKQNSQTKTFFFPDAALLETVAVISMLARFKNVHCVAGRENKSSKTPKQTKNQNNKQNIQATRGRDVR